MVVMHGLAWTHGGGIGIGIGRGMGWLLEHGYGFGVRLGIFEDLVKVEEGWNEGDYAVRWVLI